MANISLKSGAKQNRDTNQKKNLRNKRVGNKPKFIVTEISKTGVKNTFDSANDKLNSINDANNNNYKPNKYNNSSDFRKQSFKKPMNDGLMILPATVETKILKLKTKLRKKGLDGEEIKQIINKKRRFAENKHNRDMKSCCFKCRQIGHKMSECPLTRNDNEQGVDICYKCGSGDHKLSNCTVKGNELPFAKCFICSRVGHLTRSCPNNKRGVYPKGGNCKNCGSVNHMIKDCPTLQEHEDIGEEITLSTLSANKTSADAELIDFDSTDIIKKEVKRFIKF